MKIGVIGMGRVGTSVAVSTLQQGVARELLVNDQQVEVAEGEALDLAHGAAFYPAAHVRASSRPLSTTPSAPRWLAPRTCCALRVRRSPRDAGVPSILGA